MSFRSHTNSKNNRVSTYYSRILDLFTPKRFVLLFLLVAAILVTPAWQAWQAYVQLRTNENQLRQIIGVEGSIMHRDEVLTMSAKMAAATGNLEWVTRYEKFGPRLNPAIKEILDIFRRDSVQEGEVLKAIDYTKLGTIENKAFDNDAVHTGAILTTMAHDKLFKVEKEALDLVRRGNNQIAAALLKSQDYEQQKIDYQKGMAEFVGNARKVLEARRDKLYKKIRGTFITISAGLMLMIVAWFIVHQMRKRLHERIQTKQKLGAFIQEWQETFNAINDAVCIIDKKQGKILQCNKAMANFLKKTYQEIIGQSCCQLIHGSTEPVKNCPLVRMWRTRRSETTVLQMDENWLQIKVEPVIDNDGNLVGAVHIVSDITEQKNAQHALQESEKKFRLAFANARDAIIWADSETGILINCNRAAEELFGKTRKAIIGRHHTTLHPEKMSQHYQTLFKELAKGLKNNIEAEILTKSAEKKTVTITASTMLVEGKEIIQAIIRDITDSKRAIQEIENLAKFPSEDPNPVLRISKDCTILYANDASSHVLKTWKVKQGESLTESWSKKIKDVCLSGDAASFELSCIDGRTFFITLQPIRGADYLNAYGLDITKRKKAEKEKIDLELKLSQKQKMEAIGTLAGGIAHDFNNILAAMQSYVELSIDDLPEATPVRDNLQQVLSCGNRAAKLIKQVLTFSRKDQQQKEQIQIASIIKEVLNMLRSSLPATIKIRRKIQADSSMVLADPTQVHQVLVNLCTNAAHAMRETGGLLEVSLTDVNLDSETEIGDDYLQKGPYIKLTVSDTGCGMDKDVLARIFEPFFTTKNVNEGSGLGLSVVHGIVKSHDGAISVDSTPGKGTTFDIFLPKIQADQLTQPQPVELTTRENQVILLVDDQKIFVDVTKQILERLGYIVVAKTNSIDALEAFQEDPDQFDLVITDQIMPNLTGTQLAEELIAIRPDIPVILCTGFGENVSQEQVNSIGIKKFINKPISKQQIAAIIRDLLEKSPTPNL